MVLSGILYYQDLEKENISLLEEKCGNYEAKISSLNKRVINNINTPKVDFEINTNVNETGRRATDGFNPT